MDEPCALMGQHPSISFRMHAVKAVANGEFLSFNVFIFKGHIITGMSTGITMSSPYMNPFGYNPCRNCYLFHLAVSDIFTDAFSYTDKKYNKYDYKKCHNYKRHRIKHEIFKG